MAVSVCVFFFSRWCFWVAFLPGSATYKAKSVWVASKETGWKTRLTLAPGDLPNGGLSCIVGSRTYREGSGTFPRGFHRGTGEILDMKNESVKTLQIRRAALLKKLAQVGPLVQSSFCRRTIKCGKPGCRCAEGQPHEAYVLTRKVRGKTVTTHVPRDLRGEVESWAREHKRVKQLLKEISDLSDRIIRIHVRTSRAVARNRARASRIQPKHTGGCSDTTSPDSSNG